MTVTRGDIFKFGVIEYYNNDINSVIKATDFTPQQLTAWLDGTREPQKSNVEWLMHCAFAPEFMVIREYLPIETAGNEQTIRTQLSVALKKYKKSSGIYAFYDSMANLVYIGKSNGNLFEECCTQLKAAIKTKKFPKGAKQPMTRIEMVRYVSVYYVKASNFVDHAKHIESLILRISKPILNSNIGKLEKANVSDE